MAFTYDFNAPDSYTYGYVLIAKCTDAAAGDASVIADCTYTLYGADYTPGGNPINIWTVYTVVPTTSDTVANLNDGTWD